MFRLSCVFVFLFIYHLYFFEWSTCVLFPAFFGICLSLIKFITTNIVRILLLIFCHIYCRYVLFVHSAFFCFYNFWAFFLSFKVVKISAVSSMLSYHLGILNIKPSSFWDQKAIYLYLFQIWFSDLACGIPDPQPGIIPEPLSVRAWRPNHWTTREFPCLFCFC